MKSIPLTILVLALFLALSGFAQTPTPASAPPAPPAKSVRASAYYHAALGHLYSELAEQYGGRGEYVTKAIDNYKLAMREDPSNAGLAQELADLYLQSGQIRTAVTEFEEAVQRNPDDLNARRILARLYTARIRETQQSRANEEMLKAAIAQHEKIAEQAPKDVDNWLMLGRLQKLAQNSSASEKAYKKALELDPENEDALTGLAMVYTDLGDTAAASQMLKKVVAKNPNLRTLTALASAYEQMHEYKLAAETYKQALELNKENTDLKRAYAQALFTAEDFDTAQVVFEELIAEDPNDLLAALRLSQLHRNKQDFAKAHEYASKASQLDPTNLEIQYNEVILLEAEGKTSDAIARLNSILASMPKKTDSVSERGNRALLLEKLGILYRLSDQTTEAVAAFRQIVELDADAAPRASAQIIDAYRAGKNYPAAEKEMKTALARYPDNRTVKIISSNVLTDLGHYQEAEALIRGLMDGKSDRDNWIALAQIQEKAKDYAGMAKSLDKAADLSKTDEEKENIFFMRGAMYERQKKYELAEDEFRKALKINPKSAAALNYLGYMLADRNIRLPEALEDIQKAVALDPTNSAYLDSLGWVYYRMDRLDEAVEQLKRSLARGSRDATVYDHLGDVYNAQNNLKDAISQWDRAIQEWGANPPSDIDPAEVAKIQKKLEGAKVRLAKESGARNNN